MKFISRLSKIVDIAKLSLTEAMSLYGQQSHAMQSGVAMKMNKSAGETSPKSLRTGINANMSDHGALVALLVDKGIFTDEEYAHALVDRMAAEKESYEDRLSELMGGASITLG